MAKETAERFPNSIDINPTAKCNLRCSFCWGPDHSIPDGLSTEEWKKTMSFFSSYGTKSIIFTGGEPLVRKDLSELIQYAKFLDLRVTLSTNTLLLPLQAKNLLPYIDDIGIPLDGSNREKNAAMRLGNPKHFNSVIDSLSYIKTFNPLIDLTVRTVVSKINQDDIENIGELLSTHRSKFDRWKLYQFAPFSYGQANEQEHAISTENFHRVAGLMKRTFPYMNAESYGSETGINRYIFVGPQGDIYGVDTVGHYRGAGNILKTAQSEILDNVHHLFSSQRNEPHGKSLV